MYEKYKKMKKHYYYLITCLTALLLAACQNETPVERTHRAEFKLTLAGEIDQLYLSRVNDNGFADGDVMGVYVVDYVSQQPGKLQASGNRGTNVKHTFDEPNFKWNSSYDIYFRDDKTPVDIYGYYPYSAKNPEDPENYAFQVQHDQQIAAHDGLLSGYERSDFLWGKVAKVYATEHVIRLPLKHRLGNVCVKLKEGKGFSQGEWAELKKTVMVMNTTTDALINLSTGECIPQGEAKEAGILPHEHEGEYRAIVVPQTVGSGKTLFSITVEGVAYKFSKDVATVYEAGKMTNFTIEVNKKAATGDYEFRLTGESITPWEADIASHEGNMKEYVVINVPKAGTLKECIAAAGKDYTRIQSLKITGQIDIVDFIFMRDMTNLSALNLKEVKIMKSDDGYYAEDMIPIDAFGSWVNGDGNVPRIYNLVLPDNLKTIGSMAFYGQSLSGSLIIPEGVKEIRERAFCGCENLSGNLSLPSTLVEIGSYAFFGCPFTCELSLPQNLKSIGDRAFYNCSGFYGNLILPEGLLKIEEEVFGKCSNLTGDLKIPQNVKEIKLQAFFDCSRLNGRLTLPDGLEYIGQCAFGDCKFRGPLVLPSTLTSIVASAFWGNMFSGELKLPASLQELRGGAFGGCSRISGTIEIPENIIAIDGRTFWGCSSIEKLVLPSTMDVIKSGAFQDCFGLGSIVCNAVNPPYVESGAFDGVSKSNVVVEVPEASLAAYRTASGWSDFKKIVAHHELICSPDSVVALNASLQKKLVINAESDWEVEECPSWCHLDKTSGSKKTEVTLTIDALAKGQEPREDDIVFVLKDKGYTTSCGVSQCSYDYDEDEVITLQKATRGNGVNLVFLGDGYNNKDIANGTYLKDMKQQMEYFFGVEPYTTYREYFNVYTAIALSQESGVGTVNTLCDNKFETTFTGGASLMCNTNDVFKYALRMPTVNSGNLNQTLIVLTPNTTDYGGVTSMWADGSAIAITPKSADDYPYDSRGIVQHEAGGHGFGKLGDECVYLNSFIQNSASEAEFNAAKANGWYENLSLTNKMHEVPWAHLIFNNKYNEVVDIYEGGFMYARGVFRSELNSCMNNSVPYFNAISREAIVKRIKQYAGETYSFDEFVKNDNPNPGSRSTRYDVAPWNKLSDKPAPNHSQPIIHKGSPKF